MLTVIKVTSEADSVDSPESSGEQKGEKKPTGSFGQPITLIIQEVLPYPPQMLRGSHSKSLVQSSSFVVLPISPGFDRREVCI